MEGQVIRMECKEVNSLDEVIRLIEAEYSTRNLGEYKPELGYKSSNKLHAFGNPELDSKTHILKQLPEARKQELVTYRVHLPLINSQFEFDRLQLPELTDCFHSTDFSYILIPYYGKNQFDFNTDDITLAEDVVDIVMDLATIDVETVIKGGSTYDYQGFESEFWMSFDNAVEIGLIHDDEGAFRKKAGEILVAARNSQQMIISNGDFNPRNVIRLPNSMLVLIDWDGIVSPLEHHLAYPWLLNWQNKDWQRVYASRFEERLPVIKENLRMNLMKISLSRAVDEKGHNNDFADQMAEDHLRNFHSSLDGFDSLTAL